MLYPVSPEPLSDANTTHTELPEDVNGAGMEYPHRRVIMGDVPDTPEIEVII